PKRCGRRWTPSPRPSSPPCVGRRNVRWPPVPCAPNWIGSPACCTASAPVMCSCATVPRPGCAPPPSNCSPQQTGTAPTVLGPGPGHAEACPGPAEDSLGRVAPAGGGQARRHLPPPQPPALDRVTALGVGDPAGIPAAQNDPLRTELGIRFQQLCGAVMAKCIEDTAYYQWTQLTSLCEVGGAPERFAVEPDRKSVV